MIHLETQCLHRTLYSILLLLCFGLWPCVFLCDVILDVVVVDAHASISLLLFSEIF